MKNISLIKYACLLFVSTFFFTACNDLDQYPSDNFVEDNFWTTPEKARLILNMAYNQMYNANRFWNDECLSDNLVESHVITDTRVIRNGQADPSLGIFDSEWSGCYGGIKTCNIFIEKVDRVPEMNEALKDRMKAEIRLIRAYLFFRLSNFYGAIPYFTRDLTVQESRVIAKTSRAEIIENILQELDDIKDALPTKDQLTDAEKGRITKGTVAAFRARVHLYEGDWKNVIKYCEDLMFNQAEYGRYSLFPSYSGLFAPENEYNDEVIIDHGYVTSLRTWGHMFDMIPLSQGGRSNSKAPLQSLVDEYLTLNGKTIGEDPTYNENNPYVNRDPRMDATIVRHEGQFIDKEGRVNTIYIRPGSDPSGAGMDEYKGSGANQSPTGYYVKKYYDPTADASMSSGLNLIMIRYADVLLMYAEAKNELGLMNKEVWDQTIKPIRQRAGFVLSDAIEFPSGASQKELQDIIRRERRCEFAIEGLRLYDIIRWRIGNEVLNGYVHGAKYGDQSLDNGYIRIENRRFNVGRDYLWSLPRTQMDLNPNLRPNNPGYGD